MRGGVGGVSIFVITGKVKKVIEGFIFLREVLGFVGYIVECIIFLRKREFLYCLNCFGVLRKKGNFLVNFILVIFFNRINIKGRLWIYCFFIGVV